MSVVIYVFNKFYKKLLLFLGGNYVEIIRQSQMISQKANLPNGYEYANSNNFNNCVTSDTQIIIVGTITPPAGNGYFYTAPRNKIYGYIDEARGTNLKDLKAQLTASNTSATTIINGIKNTLISKNIAFLDVFESVIRKNNSPYDADIQYATLDNKTFQNAFTTLQGKTIKVICNSRLAESGFNAIMKNVTPNCTINSVYLSQRCGKKDNWIKEL